MVRSIDPSQVAIVEVEDRGDLLLHPLLSQRRDQMTRRKGMRICKGKRSHLEANLHLPDLSEADIRLQPTIAEVLPKLLLDLTNHLTTNYDQ